jgi:hypothetical protein
MRVSLRGQQVRTGRQAVQNLLGQVNPVKTLILTA